VLFVTWDGPGSTYLQGLFLPIFARLQSRGFAFEIVQFTWSDAAERARLGAACRAAGVGYRAIEVWRRPIAAGSLVTALSARRTVRRLARELAIDLIMPRSSLPALAAMPVMGRRDRVLPVLLDADGLPHDERVEFNGASPTGLAYHALRAIEAWSVRHASAVMVRTRRAAAILTERAGLEAADARFHCVANARDARLFSPPEPADREARRAELGVAPGEPLLVYAGSALSGKYRGEAVLRMFRAVRQRRADAKLLLLMPDHAEAKALLARFPELAPHCRLRSASPDEVPPWIGAADLGLALIRATFSMQAVAAIKIGEYLLCGVPVLASSKVGDSDAQIGPEIGRLVGEPDEAALSAAADWFDKIVLPDREGFGERCRAAGVAHFSLDSAVQGYEDALRAALAARQ
jgi:glycosyltransferase involved in cell wall biosynthesis